MASHRAVSPTAAAARTPSLLPPAASRHHRGILRRHLQRTAAGTTDSLEGNRTIRGGSRATHRVRRLTCAQYSILIAGADLRKDRNYGVHGNAALRLRLAVVSQNDSPRVLSASPARVNLSQVSPASERGAPGIPLVLGPAMSKENTMMKRAVLAVVAVMMLTGVAM